MNRMASGATVAGIAMAVWLGSHATADAVPSPKGGGSSAADVISQLESQGYSVQVQYDNGNPRVALSECTVTGVSGDDGSNADGKPHTAGQLQKVYVHVNCPNYG